MKRIQKQGTKLKQTEVRIYTSTSYNENKKHVTKKFHLEQSNELLENCQKLHSIKDLTRNTISVNDTFTLNFPIINIEHTKGIIFQTKELRALYYPLIVKCRHADKERKSTYFNMNIYVFLQVSSVYVSCICLSLIYDYPSQTGVGVIFRAYDIEVGSQPSSKIRIIVL